MASRFQDDRKRDLSQLEEECISEVPRKRISPSSKENMRKDKKPVQEKSAFFRLRTTANWAVSSPRKSYRIIQAKRRTPRLSLSPRSRRRTLPVTGDRDMANKENEVAFGGNLQEKLLKESRTYLLNSSDPGTSQTDGPSSKYSSFFTEVSSHHDTMTQVLFSRNLRLSVALTFWRRQNICELTAYLLRIEDLSVLADCLPMLTNSIQEEKAYVSPGCCVDLMPMVTKLITRPYEDYKLVGLNWLQAVLRRWWLELSGDSQTQEDGIIDHLRKQLKGAWEHGRHLCLLPGYTGNLAKDVEEYILQLH
ncbi:KATNB1-like protein 1 [Pleurodeles waltl]|uniref:KATNB1-like protein 1 n=1 Tax=Pleurodeles waltl TaxID=8319 RepID=UPI0037095BBD